jgi:hypothetical protein
VRVGRCSEQEQDDRKERGESVASVERSYRQPNP